MQQRYLLQFQPETCRAATLAPSRVAQHSAVARTQVDGKFSHCHRAHDFSLSLGSFDRDER
jgi:hypothetical protein